jgi:hypothetical protein
MFDEIENELVQQGILDKSYLSIFSKNTITRYVLDPKGNLVPIEYRLVPIIRARGRRRRRRRVQPKKAFSLHGMTDIDIQGDIITLL